MSDLDRRLVDDPGLSPMASALLRSAQGDAPTAQSRQAIARGLGIAAGGAVMVAGSSAAAWWAGAVVAVTVATGSVVGYVVTRPPERAMASVVERAQRVSMPAPALAAPAPALAVMAPAPAPAAAVMAPAAAAAAVAPVAIAKPRPRPRRVDVPAPAVIAPALAVTAPTEVAPLSAPVETAPAAPAPVDPAPVASVDTSQPAPLEIDPRVLAAEVALLDRARARLAAGDAAGAIALVDRHAREFRAGVLSAEAEVVRIDALLRLGQRDRAQRAGQQFLRRFPRSPLAQRVRSLLSRDQ